VAKKKVYFSPPRGMRDMLPYDHSFASFIKRVIRYRCRQSGIRRITTPIFEKPIILQNLPQAHWGERALITYPNGENNDLLLRNNFLLGVMRSYITHKMHTEPQPVELYALDLCFHTETKVVQGVSQNYLHQFLGFDIEIIGEDDPALDAQILKLWKTICEDAGIGVALHIRLSKIGDIESRTQFIADLQQYYSGKERSLCDRCRENLHTKPLALLSCEEEDCKILAKLAPKIDQYLSSDVKEFYLHLEEYLEALGVDFEWQENLFPEDISVFQPLYGEIYLDKKKIGYTGHYSRLLAEEGFDGLSGRSLFINLEDVIEFMQDQKVLVPFKDNIHVYIAQLGPEAKKKGLSLLYALREQGIKAIGSMGKGSMQEQVDMAYKFKIPYCLLLGRMEVQENTILIRDMKTGKRETVPFAKVIDKLLQKIPAAELDKVKKEDIEKEFRD